MQPISACDAVIFDVGGTLLHVPRDPQEAALERIAHLGAVSLEAFRVCVREAVAEWHRTDGQPHREDLADTWVLHYERALAAAQFPGDRTAAARLIEESFLIDGWEVFSDVIPVLEALRARDMTLGIISNWPATLERTLERAGLHHYFSVVVSSGVAGYAKPHPQIFHLAANTLGLKAERLMYVGDDFEHDVVGSTQAGWQCTLLDRRGRYPTHPGRISGLLELEALLDSLPPASPLTMAELGRWAPHESRPK
jgi:putative hydrolase of the HAD superfamily